VAARGLLRLVSHGPEALPPPVMIYHSPQSKQVNPYNIFKD
jgi:hypothetical protein